MQHLTTRKKFILFNSLVLFIGLIVAISIFIRKKNIANVSGVITSTSWFGGKLLHINPNVTRIIFRVKANDIKAGSSIGGDIYILQSSTFNIGYWWNRSNENSKLIDLHIYTGYTTYTLPNVFQGDTFDCDIITVFSIDKANDNVIVQHPGLEHITIPDARKWVSSFRNLGVLKYQKNRVATVDWTTLARV